MKLSLLAVAVLITCPLFAQVVPVDSARFYVGKEVTVYGKVTEAHFNYAKKNDTTILLMADSLAASAVKLIIYPDARVGFGFRPEEALLNKVVYVTGLLAFKNGEYQLVIGEPFDIAFSRSTLYRNKPNVGYTETSANLPLDFDQLPAPPRQLNTAPKPTAVANNQQKEVVKSKDVAKKNKEKQPANKPVTTKPVTTPPLKTDPNPLIGASSKAGDSLVGKQLALRSNVKLRSGPGTFFTSSGSIDKGKVVQVISCSEPWCKIVLLQPANLRPVEGYVQVKKLLKK